MEAAELDARVAPGDGAKALQSREYRHRRLAYLRDNPFCEACQARGIVTAAAEVDHRVPRHKGGSTWDTSNWAGLCAECHSAKTSLDRPGGRLATGLDGWPVDRLTGQPADRGADLAGDGEAPPRPAGGLTPAQLLRLPVPGSPPAPRW